MKKRIIPFLLLVLTIIITTIILMLIKKQPAIFNNKSSNISIISSSSINKDETNDKIKTLNEKLNSPLLKLINKDHILDLNYSPELSTINGSNKQVDKKILTDLNKMLIDGKNAGIKIYIQSAFRSASVQKNLYDNKINELLPVFSNNKSTATIEASKIVAPPGTSEHQYGLSLDIVENSVSSLVPEVEENTATYKWLYDNCSKYGFILRYPKNKTEITGIMYEPWHFRYVGVENATTIMSLGLTLEEYIEQLNNEKEILQKSIS